MRSDLMDWILGVTFHQSNGGGESVTTHRHPLSSTQVYVVWGNVSGVIKGDHHHCHTVRTPTLSGRTARCLDGPRTHYAS